MKIFKQGAEAVLYFEKVDGRKVLVKERIKKRYRLKEIDEKLRATRTKQEIKLMREARGHGVLTPGIVSSDEKSCKISMENLEGVLVKDFLEKAKNYFTVCRKIGENIGRLHSAKIIHGDLTTSNMILKEGKLYFIDFGLGQFSGRIEDMATDLSVLKETLTATHNKISKKCWVYVKEGYLRENRRAGEVFERLEKIGSRARYKE